MIIFLDFDGVLHPDAVYARSNKHLELKALGALFMHAPVLINALVPFPEAQIILSTSWVRMLLYGRTLKKMPDLRKRVAGATLHKGMRQSDGDPFSWMTTYELIKSHIKPNGVKNLIAFDNIRF